MHSELYLEGVVAVSLLLGVASAAYMFAKRFPIVPFPVLLLLLGVLFSATNLHELTKIKLEPGLVLFVFLPILLFESAYNFDFREFRKILAPGFILASLGLLISGIIIALGLQLFLQIPFADALLFGCVISSTDPVAVLSIFKQLGIPKRLQLLVDGESFINDATSVVAFRIILPLIGLGGSSLGGVSLSQNDPVALIINNLSNFGYVLIGGVLVGLVFGWLFAELLSLVNNVSVVETTLTIILASLVYIITDHYLKMSGIIAVLAAGLVVGNYGRTKISPAVVHNLHQVWEFLVYLVTAVIFLLIGSEVQLSAIATNLIPILLGVLLTLVARAVSVYLIGGMYNLLVRKERRIPMGWLHVTNVGGLRGVLPLVVILSLPVDYAHRELFTQITLASVLFTMVLNTQLLTYIIRQLGLDKPDQATTIEATITEALVLQKLKGKLHEMSDCHEICAEVSDKHNAQIDGAIAACKERLSQWAQGSSELRYDLELEKVLRRYCLFVEQSAYTELFEKAALPETIYMQLSDSINAQLELINSKQNQFGDYVNLSTLLHKRHVKSTRVSLNDLRDWLNRAPEKSVRRAYLYYKARLLGNTAVLTELKHLGEMELANLQDKVLRELMSKYKELIKVNEERIDFLRKENSVVANSVDEEVYRSEATSFIAGALTELGEAKRVSSQTVQALLSLEA